MIWIALCIDSCNILMSLFLIWLNARAYHRNMVAYTQKRERVFFHACFWNIVVILILCVNISWSVWSLFLLAYLV